MENLLENVLKLFMPGEATLSAMIGQNFLEIRRRLALEQHTKSGVFNGQRFDQNAVKIEKDRLPWNFKGKGTISFSGRHRYESQVLSRRSEVPVPGRTHLDEQFCAQVLARRRKG